MLDHEIYLLEDNLHENLIKSEQKMINFLHKKVQHKVLHVKVKKETLMKYYKIICVQNDIFKNSLEMKKEDNSPLQSAGQSHLQGESSHSSEDEISHSQAKKQESGDQLKKSELSQNSPYKRSSKSTKKRLFSTLLSRNPESGPAEEPSLIKKQQKRKKNAAPPEIPLSSLSSSSQSLEQQQIQEKAAPYNKQTESKKLYVGNLPEETTASSLKKIFKQYGHIDNIHVATNQTTGKSKGFCFIEFNQIENAISAKEELDLQVWEGKKIRIQYCSE